LTLFAVDTAVAAPLFAIVWRVCVRVHNYGFLDVTWTGCIGLLALIDGLVGTGSLARRVLFTLVGVTWSLRLGLFVLARVLRHHPAEDKRYRSLRQTWPTPGALGAQDSLGTCPSHEASTALATMRITRAGSSAGSMRSLTRHLFCGNVAPHNKFPCMGI
jgi:hypothetical protein